MIENSVDAPTGTGPGSRHHAQHRRTALAEALVTVQLTFREEDAVTVPSTAVR